MLADPAPAGCPTKSRAAKLQMGQTRRKKRHQPLEKGLYLVMEGGVGGVQLDRRAETVNIEWRWKPLTRRSFHTCQLVYVKHYYLQNKLFQRFTKTSRMTKTTLSKSCVWTETLRRRILAAKISWKIEEGRAALPRKRNQDVDLTPSSPLWQKDIILSTHLKFFAALKPKQS